MLSKCSALCQLFHIDRQRSSSSVGKLFPIIVFHNVLVKGIWVSITTINLYHNSEKADDSKEIDVVVFQ
jgi:hypothetical protein